jgi:hypothetical protein
MGKYPRSMLVEREQINEQQLGQTLWRDELDGDHGREEISRQGQKNSVYCIITLHTDAQESNTALRLYVPAFSECKRNPLASWGKEAVPPWHRLDVAQNRRLEGCSQSILNAFPRLSRRNQQVRAIQRNWKANEHSWILTKYP